MNDFLGNLKETIKETKEVAAELGDTALESIVDNEIIEKVPVLSWAYKAYQIKNTYHLKKLQRNIKAFLEAIKLCDNEKMSTLLSKYINDERKKEDFSDNLLNILLDSEKPIKAEALGRLLVALSESQITEEEFNDLSLILISASIPALSALSSFMQQHGSLSSHKHNISEEPLLLSLGVCSRNGSMLQISNLGDKLYSFGLRRNS